jgi:hypothetical protein
MAAHMNKNDVGALNGNLPHFTNIDNQRNMWEVSMEGSQRGKILKPS